MKPLKQEIIEQAIEYRLHTVWNLEEIKSMLMWKFGDCSDYPERLVDPAMKLISSPLFELMRED